MSPAATLALKLVLTPLLVVAGVALAFAVAVVSALDVQTATLAAGRRWRIA